MKALIDGDILIYRCGFAIEHSKYNVYIRGEEFHGPIAVYNYKKEIPKEQVEDTGCSIEKETEIEPLENCLHAVSTTIEAILDAVETKEHQVYLSGEGNFREKIAVTSVYKGNRDPLHKPKYYNDIKEYLVKRWNAVVVDGMEADDAMGIEQWNWVSELYNDETIICTTDKDLDQIIGWHYNFVKKEKYWIDEDVALRNFYTQLLTGDPVDNVQGIQGMGPSGARKILEGCRTREEYYAKASAAYVAAYGDKGMERLNEMAQLVWIRRERDKGWIAP